MAMLAVPSEAKSGESKISPALLALAKAQPKQELAVIVRASPSNKGKAGRDNKEHRSARAAEAARKAKGKVGHGLSIVGSASATLTGAQILDLANDSDVAYVSADDVLTTTFDPTETAPLVATPGTLAVGAPTAWTRYAVTGRGIGVAVLDSGIAPHPDLAGRVVASVDFTSGAPGAPLVAAADPGGHGTHVAGLIAGDGAASGGRYAGVAPGANLIDVRVIGAGGATNVSTLLRGMQWVLANRTTYNIRVVNLSAGGKVVTSYRNDPLATGVEILTFSGIAVVVSAGNNGPGESTITSPGSDPYVITVGATDDNATPALEDDSLPFWSSRGPTAIDLLSKPDVVAPGRKMVSLRSPGSTLDREYPDRMVAGLDPLAPAYFRLSGTSMAAPMVTGIVALMLERNPSLTPAEVKQRLKATATPLLFGSTNTTGAGFVDAVAAVNASDSPSERPAYGVSDGFAAEAYSLVFGQPITWRDLNYNGGVDSSGRLWTDVTWDNVVWNDITWEDITWEAFSWSSVAWQDITWEDITWEATSQSVNSLSAKRGSALLD
ncbi:MAG TPA: S8 family peptidase [Candidatus Limnocylindria bacterium]|jgi:serine protease AprX|nr:S8 family peptidase [Candidatus Limnocylindria bacterium]